MFARHAQTVTRNGVGSGNADSSRIETPDYKRSPSLGETNLGPDGVRIFRLIGERKDDDGSPWPRGSKGASFGFGDRGAPTRIDAARGKSEVGIRAPRKRISVCDICRRDDLFCRLARTQRERRNDGQRRHRVKTRSDQTGRQRSSHIGQLLANWTASLR
jgi:hypothetical protein